MPQTVSLGNSTSGEVRISPDGTRIYVAGTDGVLRVYDTLTGALLNEWQIGGSLGAMDLSPDGGLLVIFDTQSPVMFFVDLNAGGAVIPIPYPQDGGNGLIEDVAIFANQTALIVQAQTDGGIPVLRLLNLNSLTTVSIHSVGPGTVLSRSAGESFDHVLVTQPTGLMSVATPSQLVGTSGLGPGSPVAQAISQDYVATGERFGRLRIFSSDGLDSLALVTLDDGKTIRELEFSADGQLLYILGNNGATLYTMSMTDLSIVASFETGLQFSSDLNAPLTLLVDPRGQFFTIQSADTSVIIENPDAPAITGTEFPDQLVGTLFGDTIVGLGGNDEIDAGDGVDFIDGGLGYNRIEGGTNVDTLVVSGNLADYTISQIATGRFEISDGGDVNAGGSLDDVTGIEFVQFADQTIRLLAGAGVSVNFETADPSVYQSALEGLRDFDGNDLGGDGFWLRIGSADVNGDGDIDQILVNDAIGRFATVGTAPDGLVYFDDFSWAGETRVAGIYIDPLVQSGDVAQGSDQDSQRRFQNDLEIENINRVLGADDYDNDGIWEVYFALTDGTAYLRALMHEDGNIRYANYQSEQEVIDYLTANGYDESTFGDWFGSGGTSTSDEATFVNRGEKAFTAEVEALTMPEALHARAFDEWQAEAFG